MKKFAPGIAVLTLCLVGCGAATGNETAAENNEASANAAVPAGNPLAETPVGPCPFATRGWTATLTPPAQPGETPSVALNGEVRPDGDGRMPMISAQGERQAPVLVIELISDPMVDPQADRNWTWTGGVFDNHTPDFTEAAVRCAGTEIARVPIQPS